MDLTHYLGISKKDFEYGMGMFLGLDLEIRTVLGMFDDWGKYKPNDTINFINRLTNKTREVEKGDEWERMVELLKEAVSAEIWEGAAYDYELHACKSDLYADRSAREETR